MSCAAVQARQRHWSGGRVGRAGGFQGMWRSQLGGGTLCHTEDGWTGKLSITKISQCLLGWEESFGSECMKSRSARNN